jgi:hypothetical protein
MMGVKGKGRAMEKMLIKLKHIERNFPPKHFPKMIPKVKQVRKP